MTQIVNKGKTALSISFERASPSLLNAPVTFIRAGSAGTELMAFEEKKSHPGDLRNMMVAGMALAHHVTFATRNTAHLEDVAVTVVNARNVSRLASQLALVSNVAD